MKTHDGHQLHVRTYGPADAEVSVFLAHCWTLNMEDWHYQVRALLEEFGRSIQIITWDHRGHGRSAPITKPAATISHLARDWADLIEAHAPTGKLVLAGHSIGGMTMMALAEQRPELFSRVVGAAFVSTSSGRLDRITLGLPEMGPVLRRQIPRMLALRSATLSRRARRRAPIIERQLMRRFVFGTPIRLADTALAVDGLINSPGATVVGFYEDFMTHDRSEALSVFDGIPTQVLVGTRDVLTPPSHARRIAAGIDGAVLTVAPDAGHMLPLERDALVSSALGQLIAPHVPSTTTQEAHR